LAQTYLESIRGKWINWNRKEDQTPEVPESWTRQFLDLILHKDCRIYLTESELSDALRFRQISSLLSFYHNAELQVKMVDLKSVDTKYPDHMIECRICKINRPLSLMASHGDCGYCMAKVSQHTPIDIEYKQVRCVPCGAIYSVNSSVKIPGHSKCYACRFCSIQFSSPKSTCSVCDLKFINWLGDSKFTDSKCGGCIRGLAPRKLTYNEFPILTHQLFGNHFKTLCSELGFGVQTTFKPNSALYDAVLHIVPIISVDPIPISIPTNVLFRDNPVSNVEELWTQTLEIMKGHIQTLPECAVCMETVRPSDLTRSCGRKGCEQRVCHECSKSWYGQNTVGSLIYQRATTCQFCARLPAPKILSRVNKNLIDLAFSIAHHKLDSDKYYAWCMKCFKQSEIGDRACGEANTVPNIKNHVCKTCIPIADISVRTKECPKCTVSTEKSGGCNHIECVSCHTHWCWECGQDCLTSGSTYAHMHDVHGRIYEEEEPHHTYYDTDEDVDDFNEDD
jgi:hypothetical protein